MSTGRHLIGQCRSHDTAHWRPSAFHLQVEHVAAPALEPVTAPPMGKAQAPPMSPVAAPPSEPENIR